MWRWRPIAHIYTRDPLPYGVGCILVHATSLTNLGSDPEKMWANGDEKNLDKTRFLWTCCFDSIPLYNFSQKSMTLEVWTVLYPGRHQLHPFSPLAEGWNSKLKSNPERRDNFTPGIAFPAWYGEFSRVKWQVLRGLWAAARNVGLVARCFDEPAAAVCPISCLWLNLPENKNRNCSRHFVKKNIYRGRKKLYYQVGWVTGELALVLEGGMMIHYSTREFLESILH